MSVIASWGNHFFRVEKSWIKSISNMEIRASCETDEKKNGGVKYVARKNSNPSELKITIPLHAHLGINVKKEAQAFLSEAMSGAKGYFYAGTKKLFTYQLMLIEVTIINKTFTPKGDWVSADVELFFKQCSKLDGRIPSSSRPDVVAQEDASQTETDGTNPDGVDTGDMELQHAQDTIATFHDHAHIVSAAFVEPSVSCGGRITTCVDMGR